ncbi:MAG: alpha/beta hydrolase family protein [Egibacteraceae bacterium]
MLRWLRRLLVATVVLAALAFGGVGWYYADEILVPAPPAAPSYETRVEEVGRGRVVLAPTDAATQTGTWGLAFADGYARVGDDLDDGPRVVRPVEEVDGLPTAGQAVHVDGTAYPDDPDDADFGFAVTEVLVEGPLGRYPAWFVPGRTKTWAIFVHGRGTPRSECFRLLPTFVEAGLPSLCVTYRNDTGAPASPDGLYHQGDTEWQDVAAAVDHAQANGAERVVLIGYSMGGQVTANFLRRSDDADDVAAVIWDAPLLDWGPVLRLAADDRGVPRWVVPVGMFVSGLRARLAYDDLDQVANADEFDVPILLFHGTDDTTVPASQSRGLAAARPDLVTYIEVADADHVRAWNAAPRRYERAVRRFLGEALLGTG